MSKNFSSRKQAWMVQLATGPDRVGEVALRLAILLSSYLNQNTEDAWPSRARLARQLEIAPTGVTRAIKRLVAAGHLEVHKKGRGNRYAMVIKGDTPDTFSRRQIGDAIETNHVEKEGLDQSPKGDDAGLKSVSAVSSNGYHERYPNHRENHLEKGRAHARPLTNSFGIQSSSLGTPPHDNDVRRAFEGAPDGTGDGLDGEFEAELPRLTLIDLERFEAAYPRKESRQNWRDAYFALSGRFAADDILMRAKEYAIEFVGRRGDAERPSDWLARCF